MRAGQLRHRIQLMVPASGVDGMGDNTVSFTPGPVIWAEIKPLMGRTLWVAQQQHEDVTHQITIRWRPDITPRYQVKYNCRTFELGPILTTDEIRHEMVVLAIEIQPSATLS